MPSVKIATVSEIPEGGMICKLHEDFQVLLAKVDGEIYAMNDVCTHQGAPLHEGELGAEGKHLITCPWHEAHFDLRSGKVQQDTPWATDTQSFEVRIEGEDVFVEL